ncbi:MAG: selenide,water dikinase [Saprospiraceae bacterium]|jgi:selenide,water dikinase
MKEKVRLTQYSHGAGCGCKIAPSVLNEILKSNITFPSDPNLIVGNESRDDAAVYDLGDGSALISTTDFFMPIVDDPETFGRIAATNAISDIYAMGGSPMMAIAILGWPIKQLGPDIARQVVEGGRLACQDAGIILAGGHSIDSPEPIFGLAVSGRVDINHLKRNDTAMDGCLLYLTKPLGVGILATAQKKGILREEDATIAIELMTQLNKIGIELSHIDSVKAMTDVTGFGLLGHLTEMCHGSNLSAIVQKNNVPVVPQVAYYLENGVIPGGTNRNWDSYGHDIELSNQEDRFILCDPQTSGGLLIAVEESGKKEIEDLLRSHNIPSTPLGRLGRRKDRLICVE